MKYLFAVLLCLSCQGPSGDRGPAGPKGDDGLAGPVGPAGLDGQNVTVVQLCPGSNHYPDVFTESAICINSKLYAVYSSNGGFLTYLSPGGYMSNAIGSACNFNVGLNCEISR